MSYAVCVIGGLVTGFILGDVAFPEFEKVFGDSLTDLFLGLGGGLLGALAHEIVTSLRPLRRL